MHELKLTQKRNSGNNRRTITVFAGSLISVGFARRFSGTTLIERKGRMGGLLGGDKDAITVNEQAFAGEKIRALFKDGDLPIVLESGNLFESGSLYTTDDRRLVEQ